MPGTSTTARRATSAKQEQIPREETIDLRHKHVGRSCKLFFRQDPLKIVRARGDLKIKTFPLAIHNSFAIRNKATGTVDLYLIHGRNTSDISETYTYIG